MWTKLSSGCYRNVDSIEILNHKGYRKYYHNFYRKSYRQRQSHDLVDNLHGWSYQITPARQVGPLKMAKVLYLCTKVGPGRGQQHTKQQASWTPETGKSAAPVHKSWPEARSATHETIGKLDP